MLSQTAAFFAAIRGSHEIAVKAFLITPGATSWSDGTLLNVVDGTVTLDCTAAIRGTLTLTIQHAWDSGTSTSSIAPYGSEIAVYRGVRFGNGSTEYALLGVYRIVTVEQQDVLGGELIITGTDRMGALDESKLEGPVTYDPSGPINTYGGVAADLVTGGYVPWSGGATITWDDSTLRDTTIAVQVAATGDDRLGTLTTMLAGINKIAFFDNTGTLQIQTAPNPLTAAPVSFNIDLGDGGVLISGDRTITRIGATNVVVVTNEQAGSTGVPVIGIAQDTTLGSPTNVNTFGKIPVAYQLPTATTTALATAAAQSLLNGVLGVPYTLTFASIPNPALQPYDVINVFLPADTSVTTQAPKVEKHIIDSIAIPLSYANTLAINTRKQTLI